MKNFDHFCKGHDKFKKLQVGALKKVMPVEVLDTKKDEDLEYIFSCAFIFRNIYCSQECEFRKDCEFIK